MSHKPPLNRTKPRQLGNKMITRLSQRLDGSLDCANVLGRVDIETALIKIRPILQVITPKPLNGSGQLIGESLSGSLVASKSCKLCPTKACYCRRQDDSTKLDCEADSIISQLAADDDNTDDDDDDDDDDQPNKTQPPSRSSSFIGRSVASRLVGKTAMREEQARRLFTTKNLNVIFLLIAIYLIKTATAGFFPDSGHEIPCKRGNPVDLLEFLPYAPKLNCYVCKCPDGFVKCEQLPGCMHTSSKHDQHSNKNKNKAKPTANHQPSLKPSAQEHIRIGTSLVYELPNQSGNSMSAQSLGEHHQQIARMVLGETTMARREQYLQLLKKNRLDSSNLTTNFQYRQIACANTRQCPGNLYCLPGGFCGCKAKYQREADFCYLRKVTCNSRLDCGERENCIPSKQIQDYYEKYNSTTNLTTSQQSQLSEILQHVDSNHQGLCVCPRGYRLSVSGVSCMDVNECEESQSCAPNALCRNKIGSFECQCPPGSYGDPRTTGCVKYECESDADCGPQAVCSLVDQVATCSCRAQFMGNAIDLINGCQPFANTSSTTNTINIATATPVPETPNPDLTHSCLEDGIKVDLQLDDDFEGAIYVLNHSQDPECRKVISGPTSSEDSFIEFKLFYGDCGLVQDKGEAKLVLVLQRDPKLTANYQAQAHNFTCRYETGNEPANWPIDELSTTVASTTLPAPTATMLITSQNGSEITSAEEGEILYLRVDVQPNDIYGALAHSCEAQTTSFDSSEATAVTDSDGCPINSALLSNWRYEEGSKSLMAKFNAFKFLSSNTISFKCHIRVCYGSGCPTVSCNSIDVLARQRARIQTRPEDGKQLNTGPISTAASNLLDEFTAEPFKEGAFKKDLEVKSNTIMVIEQRHGFNLNSDPQVDGIKYICSAWLGIILFILSSISVTCIIIWVLLSYWRTAKRKRTGDVKLTNNNSPLPPHPGLLS